MNRYKIWTSWGNVKQLIGQMSIYFSLLSMIGIAITTWHTTIYPSLKQRGIDAPFWWLIPIVGIPVLVLGIIEWRKGMKGYYNAFNELMYNKDSQLYKDIQEIKRHIQELENK